MWRIGRRKGEGGRKEEEMEKNQGKEVEERRKNEKDRKK